MVDSALIVDAIIVVFSNVSLIGLRVGNFSYSGCCDGIKIVVNIIDGWIVVIEDVELVGTVE